MPDIPFIPERITVHLGPPDSPADDISVAFPDYIKNVASNELYPTWPESALRANILAQVSFALNRVYTLYYRSRGKDFDITNDTRYDQAYREGGEIFQNISTLVDELFDDYVRREGFVEPLFASYCDGIRTTCAGLSQWGSVGLARDGTGALDILKNYYGDNIEIVYNAPVTGNISPLPGILLREGTAGNEVSEIQIKLNRVSQNYPGIPKIDRVDGVFGADTEAAVIAFQKLFGLQPDGIVGKNTWYRLQYVYAAVKQLSEIESEGITEDELNTQFSELLSLGDEGITVKIIQYFLRYIALFNPDIPSVEPTGFYNEDTRDAVLAFQKFYMSPDEVTGSVNEATWDRIYDVYRGIYEAAPPDPDNITAVPFPGRFLKIGSTGRDVVFLQTYINTASGVFEAIPEIAIDGIFGEDTRDAVYSAQSQFGLDINGIVGPVLWDILASIYEEVENGYREIDRPENGEERG